MILLSSVSYKSPAKSIFGGGFSFTCPTKTELLVVSQLQIILPKGTTLYLYRSHLILLNCHNGVIKSSIRMRDSRPSASQSDADRLQEHIFL